MRVITTSPLALLLAFGWPATVSAELLEKLLGPLSAKGTEQLCNAVSDQILSDRGLTFAQEHNAEGLFPPAGNVCP